MIKQKLHIITIPPDKQAEIKIGGLFYQRLNKLLIEYGDSVKKERLVAAVEKIRINKTENDPFAFNLETLMILLRDIESAFKDAGHAVEQEIDVDLPEKGDS